MEATAHLVVRNPLRLKQQYGITHMAVIVSQQSLQCLVFPKVSWSDSETKTKSSYM